MLLALHFIDMENAIPASSAMKSARPMPIGARKVALCFSAASIKMVKINSAVRNISMKRPLITEVFGLRVVRTASSPGMSPDTTAAAAIAPII